MYEINVNTRRVTQYVIDEAYKWLYRCILDGKYSVNRCKAGKTLLLQIEESGGVTRETYQQFLGLFDNSLFGYMLYRSKRRRCGRITTDNLYCYFARFNGEILPIGFIKDFFEDDYETSQDVQELLEKFGASERSEMSIKWRKMLLEREDSIDSLKSAFPSMFKLHPAMLAFSLVKIALTIVLMWLLIVFIQSLDVVDVVNELITNDFDIEASIIANQDIAAYLISGDFAQEGEAFTFAEYLYTYAVFFLFNVLLLIVLIVRLRRAVRFLSLVFRVIINNIRLLRLNMLVRIFEKNSIDSVGNYFTEAMTDMAQVGEVSDQDCAGIPKSMQLYEYIVQFDAESMSTKLAAKVSKYATKGLAYYPTPESLQKAKKCWRKGIVWAVLFVIVAAIINMPELYSFVAPRIFDIIADYM